MLLQNLRDQLAVFYDNCADRDSFYRDTPVFLVENAAPASCMRRHAEELFHSLCEGEAFSERYDFCLWLELQEVGIYGDGRGNELHSLAQWFCHELISQQKGRGLAVISITSDFLKNSGEAGLRELAKELRLQRGSAVFLVFAEKEVCVRLCRMPGICEVEPSVSSEEEIALTRDCYRVIWDRLSEEERALLVSCGEAMRTEEAIRRLTWELAADGYRDVRSCLEKAVRALSETAEQRGNGRIGFVG